ncbi:MAG: ABC transporter permease, partial [Desulfobacterales bacterium]|nr:ABC transporter permease [Desulfobacterales bacterium]
MQDHQKTGVTSQRFDAAKEPERTRSTPYFIWMGILSDRYAMAGAIIIMVFVLCAIFAPWLAPYGPNDANSMLRLRGPGTEGHILGLDMQGRDILSRLIYGNRMSLFTGITPVIIGALISIPLGMLAAYYQRAGHVIMRLMDVFFAFPMVLLAILFATFLGPGIPNVIMALVIVLIPYNTRVVYIEAANQRRLGYVEAARASATSDFKILFAEMLPNVVSPSIVYSTTIVGNIVITAAGLSFLGLGVQPPTAEWGIMMSEGRSALAIAPHIATLPGIAIIFLVVAFNLVGDSLRDALDPRTRLRRLKSSFKRPSEDTGAADATPSA